MDVANEITLHTGLSFSNVLSVEASQCQSNRVQKVFPAPTEGFCFDGEYKFREALKESAIQPNGRCS